ncbi:MAG: hypothetical protein PVI30_07115 [Myxococcales bacterium]
MATLGRWVSIGLWLVGTAASTAAQPAVPQAVPEPLRPWVPWVLQEVPEQACAFRGERALCRWPGRLELDLDGGGGRFEQRVQLDRRAAFVLPGGPGRWPEDVRVDAKAVAVVPLAGGHPGVYLEAGKHRVQGRFSWSKLPDRLAVPGDTAHVALRLDGEDAPFPKRDEQGQLWLRATATTGEQGERLGLTVHRRIEDGVPLRVITRIKLRVAGRAREVSLGQVLPAGTRPLSIESDLPARLEADGELRLQVRAGTYDVEVHARTIGSPEQLAYRRAGPEWPAREIWVWRADETLRQVELSGAPAIDPGRTELADDWRGLPTFVLRAGGALSFDTRRRGEPEPPPNRMKLWRELWLDLDGAGYTVRDTIDTELHQDFRLDLTAGRLGHVSAGDDDLLITLSPDTGHPGVELRQSVQQLQAEWRGEGSLSRLPAVGWSEDVQSLGGVLHLGPGYSVLAADGVDELGRTWLSRWDLFGFFFVLLVAIAVGRISGRSHGVLALLTLVLCHHEPGSPRVVWIALIALIALLRVLPAGLFRNLTRAAFWVTVASLLIVVLPFAADQVRHALYPQLADRGAFGGAELRQDAPAWLEGETMGAAAPHQEAAANVAMPKAVSGRKRAAGALDLASRAASYDDAKSEWLQEALVQDPEATVQTGPGVPTWSFRTWHMRWSGPVDRDHEVRLWLLSPPHNRLLALLRALLVAALLFVLLRSAMGDDGPEPTRDSGRGGGKGKSKAAVGAVAVAVAVGIATAGAAGSARADFPDRALLEQLQERLTRAPACRPRCVSVDAMEIGVERGTLSLTLEVHAEDRTSVALPGPAKAWVPAAVRVDGRADGPSALLDDGFLHVRMEPGIHRVQVTGPLPSSESLTLSVPDRPARTRVSADGWKVDGVREDGRIEGALQLSRTIARGEDAELRSTELPEFFRIERKIQLGPTWQVSSTLHRITPVGTPTLVRVPLLPGESITESALDVVDGALQVSMGRDDTVVRWSSTLEIGPVLELVAAEGQPWTERWSVLCGPIWHCDISGVAPLSRVQADGTFRPEFAPWPGESVRVVVSRPDAAPGRSITIDRASLDVSPGKRMLKAVLDLQVRSSRGGVQELALPDAARVQELTVNESARPLRREGDELSITLEPGTSAVRVEWQQPQGVGVLTRAPAVALGREAVNAEVTLHVPQDRFLLWVYGPDWGPAILFWAYLLLALAVGVALSRSPHSPLSALQWVLLAAGLTQVPAPAALVVVVWFFVMGWRGRREPESRWSHNVTQLVLAGWTLVALGCLYGAVHAGLLMRPDMQVDGAGSSGSMLRFYADRIDGAMPAPVLVSAPIWCWRLLMLGWSLWLAASLVRWLPWAFDRFRSGGLWLGARPEAPAPAAPAPASPTAPATEGDEADEEPPE